MINRKNNGMDGCKHWGEGWYKHCSSGHFTVEVYGIVSYLFTGTMSGYLVGKFKKE